MVTRACLRYAREGQNVTQAGPKCHTSRAKMSHKGQNVTQPCYNDGLCIIRSGVVIIWPYLTKYYIQHCSDYGRRKEKEHPCLTLPLGVYSQFVRENEFYWCHTLFKHSLTPWSERISNMNVGTDMIQFWYWNQEPSSANEFPWDRSVGSACQRSTRGVLGSLWRNAVKQSLTLNSILDQ